MVSFLTAGHMPEHITKTSDLGVVITEVVTPDTYNDICQSFLLVMYTEFIVLYLVIVSEINLETSDLGVTIFQRKSLKL